MTMLVSSQIKEGDIKKALSIPLILAVFNNSKPSPHIMIVAYLGRNVKDYREKFLPVHLRVP